jgi:ADP-ribose pyrophosphatase YjhB (NUDIX family)
MSLPKEGKSNKGKRMHYSVGAVIRMNGKYLLVDRKKEPLGFACLAGHIDAGEKPEEALKREVFEESGLRVLSSRLLFEEEVENNKCSRGVETHYWYVYECDVSGKPRMSKEESKSIGWYKHEELTKLTLEPVWRHWFKKLEVL